MLTVLCIKESWYDRSKQIDEVKWKGDKTNVCEHFHALMKPIGTTYSRHSFRALGAVPERQMCAAWVPCQD